MNKKKRPKHLKELDRAIKKLDQYNETLVELADNFDPEAESDMGVVIVMKIAAGALHSSVEASSRQLDTLLRIREFFELDQDMRGK